MIELDGISNEERVWKFLSNHGYTDESCAVIMADLNMKSKLFSNHLELAFRDKLGSASYYTSCVNNKTYDKESFINDNAGYGIAQWSYHTRKRGLYEATIEKGLSIADFGAQLEFLCKELDSSNNLNILLRSSNDCKEIFNAIIKNFDPSSIIKNLGSSGLSTSAYTNYAKIYLDKFSTNKTITNVALDSVIDSKYFGYETYVVVVGDSWWSIAANKLGTGTKMEELAEFNGKTTAVEPEVGSIIKIPVQVEVPNSKNIAKVAKAKYFINYTVNDGDTWKSISEQKLGDGLRMYELAEFNGMNIDSILYPGKTIKIPRDNKNASNYKIYTAKTGDTWWSIAMLELGSGSRMYELARFNNKSIKIELHAGDIVKIPT